MLQERLVKDLIAFDKQDAQEPPGPKGGDKDRVTRIVRIIVTRPMKLKDSSA
jgi:hypothetical protein